MQVDTILTLYYWSSNPCFAQQLEILHLNDLNSALHEFVNNDDSMAFHSYLKQSIDEARVRYTT